MRTIIRWVEFSANDLINDAAVRVTDKSNKADWWLIGTTDINEMRMLNAH